MFKLPYSCAHFASSKVMLKILQARLQQYMNWELPHVQAGFRKGRGTRDQIANICWIIEEAKEFQKKSTSASMTIIKPLTVWITTNCGKHLRDGHIRQPISDISYLSSERPVCRSRNNSQNFTWNNRLVKRWERSMTRLYIVTVYLTYMQSTSCEIPDWMNYKLESRLPGEIPTTSDIQIIPL